MNTKIKFQSFLRTLQVTIGVALIATLALGFSFGSVFANGNAGSIWTTDDSDTYQDKNQYAQDEDVYVRGENLDPDTEYTIVVTGQPGGASADPNTDVASVNVTTDSSGNFISFAYTVANDDDGEYKVSVDNKQDNYRVDGLQEEDPPTTTDVCPNLEGDQASVPGGYELIEGQCVPVQEEPEDVCPNLDGLQAAVPDGYYIDQAGQCVVEDNPPIDPPVGNPPTSNPPSSNPPLLIPVTGVDLNSGQSIGLNLAALATGIGLVVRGLTGKKK